MKKIIIFILFLAFTRVGFASGLSPQPVGIGNFFLGTPKISDSNFNQVLGLLVGPSGTPGAVGVSGANGRDGAPGTQGLNGLPGISGANGINGVNGVNGLPGAPGVPGAPGTQGVSGPAGPAGPAGTSGGTGVYGIGGGEVALKTCDDSVKIQASQKFDGDGFSLDTLSVTGIAGKTSGSNGCAGQDVIVHFKISGKDEVCTVTLGSEIRDAENGAIFSSTNCPSIRSGLPMKTFDLNNNIGLEFKQGV
jgi:hypothetical protein